MDVRIQSIHFDASEQLQAFIQKKVSKLEKYYYVEHITTLFIRSYIAISSPVREAGN